MRVGVERRDALPAVMWRARSWVSALSSPRLLFVVRVAGGRLPASPPRFGAAVPAGARSRLAAAHYTSTLGFASYRDVIETIKMHLECVCVRGESCARCTVTWVLLPSSPISSPSLVGRQPSITSFTSIQWTLPLTCSTIIIGSF